ncbi:MAG: hypothetical protein IKS59_03820 [Aeriscardovia sp.]|nr:hypothetical protein [Aeriscardovia sp.]
MLPWTLTDSDAKNIYTAMCKWYASPSNLPNKVNDTGVFFGYPNFTRDKLWYCIEYLKKQHGKGWFTEDYNARMSALRQIANELYDIFAGQVDTAGILKFLTWVYNFAKQNQQAVNYFGGANYSLLDNMVNTVTQTVVEPVKQAAETVSYAVQVPSLKSLLPDNMTLLKWGLIIGGGLYVWKFLENRTKRI